MEAFADQLYSPGFPLARCQLYCHDSTRRWALHKPIKSSKAVGFLVPRNSGGVHCCTKHGLLLASERYRRRKMLSVALFALVGFTASVYSTAMLHRLTILHQLAHLASAVRDYAENVFGRAGSKVGVC